MEHTCQSFIEFQENSPIAKAPMSHAPKSIRGQRVNSVVIDPILLRQYKYIYKISILKYSTAESAFLNLSSPFRV